MSDTADTIAPTTIAPTTIAPTVETHGAAGETVIDNAAATAAEPVAGAVDNDEKLNMALDAQDVIKTHIIAAMAVGLVPVPGVDLAGTVAVQVRMVSKICEIYGVTIRENAASTIVLSLIGGVVPVVLAGTFVSGLKVIPGLGSLAGAAGSSILGGAVTYAIGSVFHQHLESHDSLLDFDVEKAKVAMQSEFATGLKVARSLRDKVTGVMGPKGKTGEMPVAAATEAGVEAVAAETNVAAAEPAAEATAPFAAGLKAARSLRDRVTSMITPKAKPDEAPAADQPMPDEAPAAEAPHAAEPMTAEAAAPESESAEPVAGFAAGLKAARSLRDRVTNMIVAKAKPDEAVIAEPAAPAEAVTPADTAPAEAAHAAPEAVAPTVEAAPAAEPVAEAVAEGDKSKLVETTKGRKGASQQSSH